MIIGSGIGVQIGNASILTGIDLVCRPGKVLAVLGPNGAGKSTLLKVLTGILRPTEGCVTLDRRPLEAYEIKELARRRTVLSQATPITFPFLVSEVVAIGRTPYVGRPESMDDNDIVNTVLDRVECYHLKDRFYASLSGGEQQRVQFARILAQVWDRKDAYVFLDEPTAAMDIKQQLSIMEIARELAVDRGFAVLAIVHDLVLARKFADHFLYLKNGSAVGGVPLETPLDAEMLAYVYDIPTHVAASYL